jgi:hypothetical protein
VPRALQTDVRQVVEAAVVEAADVGHEADLLPAARLRGGRGGRAAAASAAATGHDQGDCAEEYERSLHPEPFR